MGGAQCYYERSCLITLRNREIPRYTNFGKGIKNVSYICDYFSCFQLLVSTGLFDTFSDEIYIWMKHLQALVLDNQNSSDLLTFVSKIFMVYIANPYPYMDRVSDFMSEAIGLETGIADNDTGKEKLDRKIEGTYTCYLT